MSRRATRRLLWLAALLLIPLPYLVAADGAVPAVRFALLGGVAAAYAGLVNGSGVAWPLSALLLGHALVYALALWAGAALLARVLPARLRGAVAALLVVAGFGVALAFDVYHTPFAADAARTSWLGLFR